MSKITDSLSPRWKPVLGILVMGLCALWIAMPPTPATFPRETLMIKSGMRLTSLAVEIASTPQQMNQGLMHRTELPPLTGMLFLLKQERTMPMWMKNTPLSLDMLFIDKDGTIVHIAADAAPNSEDRIDAGRKVLAVLEVPGGTAARYDFKVGDRVIYPAFAPAPPSH